VNPEINTSVNKTRVKEHGKGNMRYFEKNYDWNDQDLVSQYDELPLWSSYFVHLLLENIPLKSYRNDLDVGCGTGVPLIEICRCFTWNAARPKSYKTCRTNLLQDSKLFKRWSGYDFRKAETGTGCGAAGGKE